MEQTAPLFSTQFMTQVSVIVSCTVWVIKTIYEFRKFTVKENDRRSFQEYRELKETSTKNHDKVIEILDGQTKIFNHFSELMEFFKQQSTRIEQQSSEYIKWSTSTQAEMNTKLNFIISKE